GDGAGLRLEINQQEIVGGWATGNGVIAWPESGKINRMPGDSRGQVKGVFGDCQCTCFPDCQLALSPDPAMNQKNGMPAGIPFFVLRHPQCWRTCSSGASGVASLTTSVAASSWPSAS